MDERQEPYGHSDFNDGEMKRRLNKALRSSASGIKNVKQVMPILLVLSQLGGVEGLGLGALAVGMMSQILTTV